ncbi:MAG: bifunctional diaminohydroxyphosphoribosylaminopyrimidine deaminase/5-amino-6-(5-phosphoribosylamino)uracil reductase RibD [Steroidobacteraceae bacterium]
MSSFSDFDRQCMQRALELAARGIGTTDPNPRVGCVIARDGAVIAEGWHEAAGQPHAEAIALAAAGTRAAGATLYVTLEPCAHHGRTPPCTEAIIGSRVGRVIYAIADPNPKVVGGGAQLLMRAGIEVACGLLAEAASELNVGFLRRMRAGRPWVRLKIGASLDGRTALANGASHWITSEEARADVQLWRARSGAVMTGVGTVLADDPRLNVRSPGKVGRQPLRVILDSHLSTPPSAAVFSQAGAVHIFTVTSDSALSRPLQDRGATVEVVIPAADGRVNLAAVLSRLAELETNELLVEAGSRLAGTLVGAGLVDELLLYIAPTLLGSDARPLATMPPLAALGEAPHYALIDHVQVGPDLRLRLRQAEHG